VRRPGVHLMALTGHRSCGAGKTRCQEVRGPMSTWFQSLGIPVSGLTGLPPPHLSPAAIAAWPKRAFS